jgi:multiple sugar transport system substrate-binding protein
MYTSHRRQLPIIACLAAAGLLTAACGGSSGGTPKAAAKPKAISGTVVMAEPGDNPGDLALRKKLADNFMAAHPSVTVKFTIVPGTSYDQKIQTMIAGGKAPDIFGSGDVQIPNIVAKKFALDLTPYVKRDNYDLSGFYPQIIKNLTYDKQLVGLTDNYDTQVMYYNTSLFKAAGVAEPTSSWTWADFVTAAQKLTSGTGNSKIYGAVFDNWFAPYFDQIWSNGGDPFPDNGKSCGYDSQAAVTSFTQIQDLYKSGVSPLPSAFSENGSEQAFLTGKIGMLIGNGRWSAYTFKDVKKFGWKIAPLPTGSAGRANFFHIGMFAIARTSKNPEAAFEFLKYMVSEAGIKAGLADMQGIPSRKDIADSASFKDTPFNEEHNTVQPFIESLPTVHRAPSLTNFNEVQDAVTAKLSPIWTLKGTPSQVLPNVCAAIKSKLSAGGAVGGG